MASVQDFLIDFDDEEGKIADGKYKVRIVGAKPVLSEEKKRPGLELTLKVLSGKAKGETHKENLWASPKAYGRFRTLLEALGKNVPQKLNLIKVAKAIKGEELVVEIGTQPGRDGYGPRSQVTFNGFFSIDEDIGEEDAADDVTDDDDDDLSAILDEDEEEKPKAKSKSKADDDDVDELDLDDF